MFKRLQLFHLQGGIDYSRLSFVHKSMMSMLRKMLLKKETGELRDEERQILETYGTCIDFTDRESIKPLVSFILQQND